MRNLQEAAGARALDHLRDRAAQLQVDLRYGTEDNFPRGLGAPRLDITLGC